MSKEFGVDWKIKLDSKRALSFMQIIACRNERIEKENKKLAKKSK